MRKRNGKRVLLPVVEAEAPPPPWGRVWSPYPTPPRCRYIYHHAAIGGKEEEVCELRDLHHVIIGEAGPLSGEKQDRRHRHIIRRARKKEGKEGATSSTSFDVATYHHRRGEGREEASQRASSQAPRSLASLASMGEKGREVESTRSRGRLGCCHRHEREGVGPHRLSGASSGNRCRGGERLG
jgi:hypothetical protein